MKYLRWVFDNIFFVSTLLLLVFIPLYPKKPVLDVVNTWVYVRAEDFVVIAVLIIWLIYLLRKKVSLQTPLTIPILLFWIVGVVATIHGVLLIFPTISGVFSNIALFSYLRRIEYLSLFFIAYSGMKDKRFLRYVIGVITGTLVLVILYGFGQKYLGFPAYLTMNEEFSKGIGIQLSSLSRVSSTFGGHYDLAAYLVLVIPIMVSLFFAVRNILLKLLFIFLTILGFILMMMTVSRVSFFAVIIALLFVLFWQNRKILLFSIPFVAFLAIILISYSPALLNRYTNTLKEIDVLVDAKTGEVVGHPSEVPNTYFQNKVVKRKYILDKEQIATTDATLNISTAIPYTLLPDKVLLISDEILSTGENLPRGTSYINLTLSPISKKVGQYFFENKKTPIVAIYDGDYLIKRATAYDLSFTTRFQGEWPNAFAAFKRNIFLGSGYGSASLAVDNNYLRILAETGLVGFVAYFGLFVVAGIYIKKILPSVTSHLIKSFIIGFVAGTVGLLLNAFLIDVFEASKIAFYLWLLMGITLGVLEGYKKTDIHVIRELIKIMTSTYAIIAYIFIFVCVLYSPIIHIYFVGDDFTWLRWAKNAINGDFSTYFTGFSGWLNQPGSKLYFLLMYKVFWLNQTMYHAVSISLHLIISILVFFLARKILRNNYLGALAGFLFVLLSVNSEALSWISSTGYLFSVVFSLASLNSFIIWEGSRKKLYLSISILCLVLGMLFHEIGVLTPLLFILYSVVFGRRNVNNFTNEIKYYLVFVLPIPFYLVVLFFTKNTLLFTSSNYSIFSVLVNFIVNSIGYICVVLLGPITHPIYNYMSLHVKENVLMIGFMYLLYILTMYYCVKVFRKNRDNEKLKIITFGLLFIFITLVPFLWLDDISYRHSYFSSIGFIILFVYVMNVLYKFLQNSGLMIARFGMFIIISLFVLLQIVQIQQIQGNWFTAGNKVQTMFKSIQAQYQDSWATESMQLYFVNVPIREGEAWVFPIGLSDGLLLVLQSPRMTIHQVSSLEEAYAQVGIQTTDEKIFVIDGSGTLVENRKPQKNIVQ